MRLELVPPPAQFCCNLRGELVTGGKEHFCAEALHQRPPAFVTRECGPEELMLCVATIGISFACRDSADVRSSPVGSVSPTVAKA